MKVLVAAHGTLGDVQPPIALALALRRRGHVVEVGVPENLVPVVTALGLPVHSIGEDVRRTLHSWRERGYGMVGMFRYLRDVLIPRQYELVAPLCPGAELIVGAGLQFAAASVAERRGVPYASVVYCPLTLPTSYGPPVVVPWQRLPRAANALLWRLFLASGEAALRGPVNRARDRLGLPPVRDPFMHVVRQGPTFVAADRRLAPPPPDLPPGVVCTDAWVLEPGGALDAATEAFLAAGPPPVYIGFGSMVTADPERITRAVVAAAERAGRRLLLGSGWTGLGAAGLPEWCHVLGEAPHARLFPRTAAVVHHGGAGTTTTAARAGVPQVIVPHLLDQHYWAHRVRALGLGPRPLPIRRLTAERLARRLRSIGAHAPAARRLAPEIAGADGTDDAVRVIEARAGRPR